MIGRFAARVDNMLTRTIGRGALRRSVCLDTVQLANPISLRNRFVNTPYGSIDIRTASKSAFVG